MSRYRGRVVHTIRQEDVGKSNIKTRGCGECGSGKTLFLGSCLGYVQAIDVGKQIIEHNHILSVESDEQMRQRLNSPLSICNMADIFPAD